MCSICTHRYYGVRTHMCENRSLPRRALGHSDVLSSLSQHLGRAVCVDLCEAAIRSRVRSHIGNSSISAAPMVANVHVLPVREHVHVCLGAHRKFLVKNELKIGTEIAIRLRSCHECVGCISLSDFASCKNMSKCGPVEHIRLVPRALLPPIQTRSALQNAGKRLCTSLKTGDVVSIEVSFGSETYMLGVVTQTWHTHEGPDVEYPMGGRTKFRLEQGDELSCPVQASTRKAC